MRKVFILLLLCLPDLSVPAQQNAVPRVSTASSHVKILDSAFYMPQLNRFRRIWVYVPAQYPKGGRYPVLYMHDGQNLFDDTSSYAGEWGVDEFLDSTRLRNCIVVGIDNGREYRMNEYNPFDHGRFGKGEGDAYVDFIVKTLKPAVDRIFKTARNRSNTFIAGSSMGGLISFHAILKYPRVFGGAGVFSPAFWTAPGIFDIIKIKGKKIRGRVFFYAGQQEGETMVPFTLKAFEMLTAVSKAKISTVIRNEGKHNEARWRAEFPLFYEWVIRGK